jgi:hypothetical protein
VKPTADVDPDVGQRPTAILSGAHGTTRPVKERKSTVAGGLDDRASCVLNRPLDDEVVVIEEFQPSLIADG